MIFQATSDVFNDMDLAFWTANIAITFFIIFLTFFRISRKDMEAEQKKSAYYWIVFLFIMNIANFIGMINRIYYGADIIIDKVSILFVNMAILIQIIYLERNIHLYKYPIFSIIQLIVVISYIMTANLRDDTIWTVILAILMVIGFSIFPLIYFYIGVKSSGPIRGQTFKIAFSIVFIAVGVMIQAQNVIVFIPEVVQGFQTITSISWVIFPTLLNLAGVLLLFFAYLVKLIEI